MDLSIIIVNWNSMEYLDSCLASIYRSGMELSFETIVVDNASFDGSEKMIQAKYPKVRYIQSNINGGFSYANNLGAKTSLGSHLLFLNPDTEIEPGSVEGMFGVLTKFREVGVVGCRLLNSDRTSQNTAIHPFPTILNQSLDSELLRKTFPRWSIWGLLPLQEDLRDPVEIEAISGACMMIKREVFKEIGGFDECYFMYSEDIDLCYTLRRAGKKNIFVPNAEIIHHSGGSTDEKTKKPFPSLQFRESRYAFFKKHRGGLYSELYRLATFISALGRIFCLFLASFAAPTAMKRRSAHDGYLRWSYVALWCLRQANPSDFR